jgi:hypothetical protein
VTRSHLRVSGPNGQVEQQFWTIEPDVERIEHVPAQENIVRRMGRYASWIQAGAGNMGGNYVDLRHDRSFIESGAQRRSAPLCVKME